MIPVQAVLPGAVAEVLRKAPLTPEKVTFAWRIAVGAAVDNATTIELHGGVLRVRAKDATWQREIERAAAVIRARLDMVLGAGVVRYVDVTVAAATSTAASAAAARSSTDSAAAVRAPSGDPSAGESGTEPQVR